MAWRALTSSNLLGCDYDAAQRVLHVKFRSGGHYSYRGVEPEIAEGLESAPSPGRYFNDQIKDKYSYV